MQTTRSPRSIVFSCAAFLAPFMFLDLAGQPWSLVSHAVAPRTLEVARRAALKTSLRADGVPTATASSSPPLFVGSSTTTPTITTSVVATPTIATSVVATPTIAAASAPSSTTAPSPSPTPPVSVATPAPRGCLVAVLDLHAREPHLGSNPWPEISVRGLRDVGGEGSAASSRAPLTYADGTRIALTAAPIYQLLTCRRSALLEAKGVVLSGRSHPAGHQSIDLRGMRFVLKLTSTPGARTYIMRLSISLIHYDRTTTGLSGTLFVTA